MELKKFAPMNEWNDPLPITLQVLTQHSGQTHRFDNVHNGYPIIEPQKSDIVIKVGEGEIANNGPNDES